MKRIIQLEAFRRELAEWPMETREDLFSLLDRYLRGERLPAHDFRTFKIDDRIKIQEFRVIDHRGNWRVISCLHEDCLVLVHAFHKKAQKLLEKEKYLIRNRIRRIGS